VGVGSEGTLQVAISSLLVESGLLGGMASSREQSRLKSELKLKAKRPGERSGQMRRVIKPALDEAPRGWRDRNDLVNLGCEREPLRDQ
jgi:hypothetical protein